MPQRTGRDKAVRCLHIDSCLYEALTCLCVLITFSRLRCWHTFFGLYRAVCQNDIGRAFQFAEGIYQLGVAQLEQCRIDFATFRMDSLCHFLPAFHLGRGVNAGRIDIALSLLADLCGLGDDEPGTRALACPKALASPKRSMMRLASATSWRSCLRSAWLPDTSSPARP